MHIFRNPILPPIQFTSSSDGRAFGNRHINACTAIIWPLLSSYAAELISHSETVAFFWNFCFLCTDERTEEEHIMEEAGVATKNATEVNCKYDYEDCEWFYQDQGEAHNIQRDRLPV